jgi:hypothetical protein
VSAARADVAIVGAGAAGLAAAIFLARRAPRLRVLLLEGARRPGAKILVSGGGRCNVTNREVGAADFWDPSSGFVRRVLRALPVPETEAFFRGLGVALHEEEHGKLFPDSNRARTVLEALLGEVARLGVELRSEARVSDLRRLAYGFEVISAAGAWSARRVALTTGGRSLPKSGSDGTGYELARRLGHGLVPPVPALAPLVVAGDLCPRLAGVTLPARITVSAAGERPRHLAGSLLFTHFGVSGPAALDASRFWHRARVDGRDVRVSVSFAPAQDFAACDAELMRLARERPRLALDGALAARVPRALGLALVAALGLDPCVSLGRLAREQRRRVVRALTEWPLDVVDSRGWSFAEATSGGIPLDEVDAATLESRRCPGLHFAGEILDVDGRLGGFNFQWAWASAFVLARGLGG